MYRMAKSPNQEDEVPAYPLQRRQSLLQGAVP